MAFQLGDNMKKLIKGLFAGGVLLSIIGVSSVNQIRNNWTEFYNEGGAQISETYGIFSRREYRRNGNWRQSLKIYNSLFTPYWCPLEEYIDDDMDNKTDVIAKCENNGLFRQRLFRGEGNEQIFEKADEELIGFVSRKK